jgi:hypothetical protein
MLIDLFFALLLFLTVTTSFPMLRVRMMIGMGFFGFLHFSEWINGNSMALLPALGVIVSSLGIFIITLTLNLGLMIGCAIFSLSGLAMYAWVVAIEAFKL